jgi:hypothetical protein
MIEGVVLRPSSFAMTTGSFPSITDTQLFVVPKSIPIIFPMLFIVFSIPYNHYAMPKNSVELSCFVTFSQIFIKNHCQSFLFPEKEKYF